MAKKQGVAKKIISIILNIFWIIFGGITNALMLISVGLMKFFCIIPIFFGTPFMLWKAVPLVFAPFGLSVKSHFGRAPFRNIVWFIFGGFSLALMFALTGVLFCITVVGIPLGLQAFKFAKWALAPYGAQIWRGEKLVACDKRTRREIENKRKLEAQAEKEKAEKEAALNQQKELLEKMAVANSANNAPQSKYAELKELKDLLDSGIITQEEFDAKKAEIMK